jgi:DNA modification methylase
MAHTLFHDPPAGKMKGTRDRSAVASADVPAESLALSRLSSGELKGRQRRARQTALDGSLGIPADWLRPFYSTSSGSAFSGDARDLLLKTPTRSISLLMTSPPFALRRKKDYGNVDAQDYVEWFLHFGREAYRVLKDDGSLVIDIGGSWVPGQPTRSLYHFELLIALCKEVGFHLAEEFFWYNPSKLPSPAEWVNVRRIRVKDAVNCVWWLSKTPNPKANNRRVLRTYSESMLDLIKNGYVAKKRPSGWDISKKFGRDNGGAIPPNLLMIPNTDSNSSYLERCRNAGYKPHPARFPADLPRFFIKFLTDSKDDVVLDIFAGSNMTGWVAEQEGRPWLSFELREDYLEASKFRWEPSQILSRSRTGRAPTTTGCLSTNRDRAASELRSPATSQGGSARAPLLSSTG